MDMKTLAAIPMALILAAPSTPIDYTYQHNPLAIVKVVCKGERGTGYGTAFKVTENAYITANHVVEIGTCFVGGKKITVTSQDEATDYATFLGPKSSAVIRVSCRTLYEREIFIARGFAGGGNHNMLLPWLATEIRIKGKEAYTYFIGDAFPGMSGAPVIDKKGYAIGVVSRRLASQATTIRQTGYCK